MNGLVTVIVPVYNCENYIKPCVNGILKQTYNNVEVILVNDGSTDTSGSICEMLSSENDRVRYYSQENSGPSVARNCGLEHAKGDFIMFVDADDELSPDIIEMLYKSMDEDTDLVCCSYEILGKNIKEYMFPSAIVAKSQNEKVPFYLQLMDYTYGHPRNNATAIGVPWGKLYRSEMIVANKIRFDSSLRRMQDNIFVMESIYWSRTVKYIPECLYNYRVDHINSYNTVSYSPEVYLGVLNRRNDFYNSHKELLTKKIQDYLFKEHLNYLMMSIHYIVAKYSGTSSKKIAAIKELCQNPTYRNHLSKGESLSINNKQKIQLIMYRLGLYRLLYFSYKYKYKL